MNYFAKGGAVETTELAVFSKNSVVVISSTESDIKNDDNIRARKEGKLISKTSSDIDVNKKFSTFSNRCPSMRKSGSPKNHVKAV